MNTQRNYRRQGFRFYFRFFLLGMFEVLVGRVVYYVRCFIVFCFIRCVFFSFFFGRKLVISFTRFLRGVFGEFINFLLVFLQRVGRVFYKFEGGDSECAEVLCVFQGFQGFLWIGGWGRFRVGRRLGLLVLLLFGGFLFFLIEFIIWTCLFYFD